MKPATVRRLTRAVVIVAARIVAGCVLVVATLLLAVAFGDRSMPDLQRWHRTAPTGEFRAADADNGFGLDDYPDMERRLFDELGDFTVSSDDSTGYSRAIRYVAGGLCDPETFDRNWNRTFELVPQEIRGGVLLVHVSIPFPPDDPLYGPAGSSGHANLGNLAPRGEKNVLNIAASDLLRLRYNPFHEYMVRKILEVVAPVNP